MPLPPMIATGHRMLGGRSVMTAALATAPATSVAGTRDHVEHVVHAGNVVRECFGHGGRAEHDQRRRARQPLEVLATSGM